MNFIYHTEDASLRRSVREFVKEWQNDTSTIDVYTSGSTGKPKKLSLRKEYMKASAQMTGEFLALTSGDTALLCMSPETIAGTMMIVRSLVLDLDLVVSDVSSTPLAGLDKTIDFAAMVPLQVEKSIRETPRELNQVKKLIIGGGSISNSLRKRVNQTPIQSFQTFGMTETISHIAMCELNATDTHYKALHGVTIDTQDNCLVISAPHLGVNKLVTNDLVELISPDEFKWLGRKDFVINSGGVKIHPELIERQLEDLLTGNYFSTGLEDELLGNKHILCVETKGIRLKKIDLSAVLTPYSIPKEVYYFDTFVRTESGKVNRLETLKTIKHAEKQVL